MATFNHQKMLEARVRPAYSRIAQLVQAIISSHVQADGRLDNADALDADLRKYSLSVESWASDFWLRYDGRISQSIARDFKRVGLVVDPQ